VEPDGREALVEATDDVEDEGAVDDVEDGSAVGDGLAEVAEVLRLAFVLPAVVSDVEVALTEGAEVGVGEQSARRLIPEELGLDGEPEVASGGAVLGDGVSEVVGDGTEEPRAHDAVHPDPIGGGGNGGVGEHMAFQGVTPKSEEKGLAPARVEGGCGVEAERD
jgi:hypothetical protein